MNKASTAVLLDTCAVIWLANGDPLARQAARRIVQAGLSGGVFVSPISAWEVGMLGNPRGSRPALQFLPNPKEWFARVMAGPAIRQATLTSEIAVEASYLPGELHSDPADRLLIATARHHGIPIVTRDTKIIAYAGQGFVQVIAC